MSTTPHGPSSTRSSPVDLIIRFTTSIPDLQLTIESPLQISSLGIRAQIRDHVAAPTSSSRLRLIWAGKVLPDTAALSRCIKIPGPPPRRDDGGSCTGESGEGRGKGKWKGKGKGKETAPAPAPAPADHPRVYIHCAVGDALSTEELAAERALASAADEAFVLPGLPSSTSGEDRDNDGADPGAGAGAVTGTHQSYIDNESDTTATRTTTTTTPSPRGFDRLLLSGFTPAEVATLRSQFLAVQAHTHTPDTMPSGDSLTALEDRWLDNEANDNSATGTSSAAAAGGSRGEAGGIFGGGGDATTTTTTTTTTTEEGGLEDMLWGNIMGFFWPVAAVLWLLREEGVWTRRRQIAVCSGMLVNLTFGFLRMTG